MTNKSVKVSVIGSGFVGATSAYAIMMEKLADEIVIVDINKDKAKAEALDIVHSTPLVDDVSVTYGTYEDTKDSDIVVVTAGLGPKYGETRLDVLNKNLVIYKQMIPEIVKYNPNAILYVVSNPVDILTYVAYKLSGFPKERVIGSGTVLDTARIKYLLGEHCNVKPREIQSFILGEHGDSQVAIWSLTTVGGIDIEKYCESENIVLDKAVKTDIETKTKKAGFDIVYGKGYTNFGIATSVARGVKAILQDENAVLPVSTYYTGEYGIEDVYMAAPCIVGRKGVSKVLTPDLTEEEVERLKDSSKGLKDLIKESR